MTKYLHKHYVFLFFIVVLLKYHAAANFSTGCRESFEMKMVWPLFLANVAVNVCQDLATLRVRTASAHCECEANPLS